MSKAAIEGLCDNVVTALEAAKAFEGMHSILGAQIQSVAENANFTAKVDPNGLHCGDGRTFPSETSFTVAEVVEAGSFTALMSAHPALQTLVMGAEAVAQTVSPYVQAFSNAAEGVVTEAPKVEQAANFNVAPPNLIT